MIEIACPTCGSWALLTDYGRGYCLACGWASHPLAGKARPKPAALGGPEVLTPEERGARELERDRLLRAEWAERGERRPAGHGRPAGWGRR